MRIEGTRVRGTEAIFFKNGAHGDAAKRRRTEIPGREDMLVKPSGTKRCLILQGGGLRGAFGAGACFALHDLDIRSFELAFAVSANVPTLAYFLAGQSSEGREVWENYLATKKLVRYSNLLFGGKDDYRHRPLIDLHYLVYQVFRDRFPLRIDRFMASRTRPYFVATDVETLAPHYFEKEPDNMYAIMHACMSLPGAVPAIPFVDGRRYLDGGIVDPVPIGKALEKGAGRILAVLTVPQDAANKQPGPLEKWVARKYFGDNPGLFETCEKKAACQASSLTVLAGLEQESPESIVVIRPPARPPAGRVTRDRAKIVRTIAQGYDEVMKHRTRIRSVLGLDAQE